METLQHVILTGLVVAVMPVVSLFFFDDDLALGDEVEAEKLQQQLPYAVASGQLTSLCLVLQWFVCSKLTLADIEHNGVKVP